VLTNLPVPPVAYVVICTKFSKVKLNVIVIMGTIQLVNFYCYHGIGNISGNIVILITSWLVDT